MKTCKKFKKMRAVEREIKEKEKRESNVKDEVNGYEYGTLKLARGYVLRMDIYDIKTKKIDVVLVYAN